MNASATGPSAQNAFSAAVFGPHRPPRRRPRAAVVVIEHRGLTRRDQDMLGDDLAGAGHDHQQPPVIGAQPDLGADQPDRHGVAGRPEPHARQPVDLAGHQPPGAGPQRRQRREQFPLDDQPLGRHRADLAVDHAVDLGAPRRGLAHSRRPDRRTAPAAPSGRSWHSRPGSPRSLSIQGRLPRRNQAGNRNAPRTAGTPARAPRRWRPPRLSGSPSGRPAPCPAPRPAPPGTPPASPASSPPAHQRRTARTAPGTRPAPRRTRAGRPRLPQSITRCSPGDHTAGRRPR